MNKINKELEKLILYDSSEIMWYSDLDEEEMVQILRLIQKPSFKSLHLNNQNKTPTWTLEFYGRKPIRSTTLGGIAHYENEIK